MSNVSFASSNLVSSLKAVNETSGAARGGANQAEKVNKKQVNGASSQADTVTLSDAAKGGKADDAAEGAEQTSYVHLASQKVVETADDNFEASLDMVLGIPPR